MRLNVAAVLLLLLVSSLPPIHGVLEAYNTDLKCKCVRETSGRIPPHLIDHIQVVPPGNGCPNTEIITRTKTKLTICLKPQAKWVQRMIKRLRSRMLSTPPAPVSKKRTA